MVTSNQGRVGRGIASVGTTEPLMITLPRQPEDRPYYGVELQSLWLEEVE